VHLRRQAAGSAQTESQSMGLRPLLDQQAIGLGEVAATDETAMGRERAGMGALSTWWRDRSMKRPFFWA
jgi:hypothetical protein